MKNYSLDESMISSKQPLTESAMIPFLLFSGVGIALGIVVLLFNNPLYTIAGILSLGAAVLIAANVELGFVFLVFITHSNLSTVFIEQFSLPSVAKILVALIVAGLVIRLSFKHNRSANWFPITLVVAVYGLTGLFSLLFEAHVENGIEASLMFVKDSLIAIITVLIIRKYELLRQVFWALIASGALLGTIALYQHLTKTYDTTYWGLSLAPSHHIIGNVDDFRLSGTLGDPNFFAMFQYVLLPLAIERFFSEKNLFLKAIAAYSAGVILFTVIYSYSRGGFLGIAVMLLAFICLYWRYTLQIIAGGIIALTIISYTPNSRYVERMLTLEYLSPDKKNYPISESSFQGRKSEMLVATLVFLDHPFFGVGLGNYEIYYQKYAQKLFIDFRKEEREAHCRYLEILAETGALGLISFCVILWLMFYTLAKSWRAAKQQKDSKMESAITALTLSLVGLLVGYIFLHDAWPRFSWLMFGIAFSISNIIPESKRVNKEGAKALV